jgi:hypothetical protein
MLNTGPNRSCRIYQAAMTAPSARNCARLLQRLQRAGVAAPPPLLPPQPPAPRRGLRTHAAAGGAAPSPLSVPFVLTLERAVGGRAGADAELAASGLFGAEVFPDLPIATTWDGLYRAMLK